MRPEEAMQLARVCRQQSQITTSKMTAAVLSDLADHYETIACDAYDERQSEEMLKGT
jgi:hypothetical protein